MTRPHANSIPHALLLALLLTVPAAFANGSSPQTPATKSPSPLFTDEQWAKLNYYSNKYEKDILLDQDVTDFLGVTESGKPMTVRQLSDFVDKDLPHFFNRIGPGPDNYLFTYLDNHAGIVHGYLTDRNLNYLRGYVSPGSPQSISPQQGKAGLAAEIRWWATSMDRAPAIP